MSLTGQRRQTEESPIRQAGLQKRIANNKKLLIG